MRLFIAIDLDLEIKKALCALAEEIKGFTRSGNFTLQENYHLTLVFLGETPSSQIERLKQIMNHTSWNPFPLALSGLGTFPRGAKEILWLGMAHSEPLRRIYDQLFETLTEAGFLLEKRPFRPHLTLGREVVLGQPISQIAQKLNTKLSHRQEVKRISLMKSERVNGKLTYTEIHKIEKLVR